MRDIHQLQPFISFFSWGYADEHTSRLNSGGWSSLGVTFFSVLFCVLFFFTPGQFKCVNYPEVKKTSFNVKAIPAYVKYLTLGTLRLAHQSIFVSFRGK